MLDFDQVMYGEIIEVDFLDQLRGVKQFDSVDDLKAQMTSDVARAREIGQIFLNQTH